MSPNNEDNEELYVQPVEETKTAEETIPLDANEWPVAIQEKLIAEHPFLSGYKIKVDLKKVDKDNQYGFGSAIVSNEDNDVNIPVIIKDGKLMPMDIFIHDEEPMPLNKSHIDKVFASYDIAEEPVDEDEHGEDAYDSGDISEEKLYAPTGDTFSYTQGSESARFRKTSSISMMDEIDGTVKEADLNDLKEKVNDERILATFAKNDSSEAVKKVASLDTSEEGAISSITDKLRDDNIFIVKESSPNKVQVLSTPKNAFYPKYIETTVSNAKDYIKSAGYDGDLSSLTPVDDVVFMPDSGNDVEKTASFDMEKVSSSGRIRTSTKSGIDKLGSSFPDVVNFNGSLTDESLFVSDSGEYSYDNEIIGQDYNAGLSKKAHVKNQSEPEEGEKGTFVIENEKSAVATEPFNIDQIATVGGNEAIYATTEMGQKVAMVTAPGLNSITKVANPEDDDLAAIADEVHFVPDEMDYVKLGEKIELIDRPEDEIKEASDGSLAKLSFRAGNFNISTDFEDVYEAGDEDNELKTKIASLNDLNKKEAKFALGTMGYSDSAASQAINEAMKQGQTKLANARKPYPSSEVDKMASAFRSKVSDFVDRVRTDLIKESAEIGDADSADKMLSLSLVNEDNIQNYVDNVDQYENTLKDLAEMLIMARVGANTLPEGALKKAMDNLDTVVEALHELESTLF